MSLEELLEQMKSFPLVPRGRVGDSTNVSLD